MDSSLKHPIAKVPIAIIGNINLDVKTSLIGAGGGILADGETGVDEIYESVGGGGANTAVAAALLGGRVHFFGRVGEDSLGDRLESALSDYGITTHLARKATMTGRSINLNWDNGSRHFISSLPNNRAMEVEDIDIARLVKSGCRQMLRSDVWFADAMLEGGNTILFERVVAAGIETYMDINWDPAWSIAGNGARIRERKEQLRRLLPLVHHAHGNERELCFFSGRDEIRDACRYLIDEGCGEVVVHRGSRGAASYTADAGWVEAAAAPVEKVVCSTGCGDVFCAAHMLLTGMPVAERLRSSARIAAEHLSGKRTLIPRLGELSDRTNGRFSDVHTTVSL